MARRFNGSSDLIDCGTPPQPSTAITLSAWFYATALPASYAFILGRSGTSGLYVIFLKSSGNLAYYILPSGGNVDPGTATITTNVWYHVAATYDSVNDATVRGWLNGAADGTTAWSGSIPSAAGHDFQFGQDPQVGDRFFNGVIADGAMWNVRLSNAEILALSRGARPSQIRPLSLLGWWPLTGLQSPEPDLSGNAHNGTLTGTTPAFGPPIAQFTPRWPQFNPVAASSFNPAWARGRNVVIEGIAT